LPPTIAGSTPAALQQLPDGSLKTNVTSTFNCYEADPAWCGMNQVVFSRLDADTEPRCGDENDVDWDIWLSDSDGNNEVRLTDNHGSQYAGVPIVDAG
jgi:hypothetical protein